MRAHILLPPLLSAAAALVFLGACQDGPAPAAPDMTADVGEDLEAPTDSVGSDADAPDPIDGATTDGAVDVPPEEPDMDASQSDGADPADAEVADLWLDGDGDTLTPAMTRPVRFEVTIPAETPSDAVVWVSADDWPEPLPLDCGLATVTCTGERAVTAPSELRWTVRLDQPGAEAALTLEGGVVAAMHTAIDEDPGPLALTAHVDRWGPTEGASAHALAFLVRIPDFTPAHEAIHIAGGTPELGAWDGPGLVLAPAREGYLAASVEIPDLRSVSFKVTRGSWFTVEKGPSGEEIPDRHADVGGGLRRVRVTVDRWADQIPPGVGTLSGEVRRWGAVSSEHLTRPRDVLLWLPPGYADDPARRFPVLYLHDGQNTMDATTAAFGVEWGVDETLGSLIAAGTIPPTIAVAVYNTPLRIEEYTPSADPSFGGGGADRYGRFLVEELKPLVDAHLRTASGPEATALMGSSLGGLVTLWLGLTYPEVFGRLGVLSPSVWWDGRFILSFVQAFVGPTDARIWLDIGTAEGDGQTPVANARDLRDALTSAGWTLDDGLTYREFEGAGHNEAAWAARMGQVLGTLLRDEPAR